MTLPDLTPLRPYLYTLLGMLLAAGGGYLFGRAHGPERVETKTNEVIRHELVRDAHAEEQVKQLTALLATLKKKSHVERTTVQLPDGTKTTKTVRDTNVEKATTVQVDLTGTQDVTSHGQVQAFSNTQTQTVTTSRPDWRVGALVGVNTQNLLTHPTLVYGAQVERRVIGPFSAGLWGLSSGQVGVSASFEF